MSIASTLAKVTSGSARLNAIHTRTQMAADVRSVSPVQNVMRSSPSRLRRPVSPSVAGELRGNMTRDSSFLPARPHTALPERSPRNKSKSEVREGVFARPSTASSRLPINSHNTPSRPSTASKPACKYLPNASEADNSEPLLTIPIVDEASDDEMLADAMLARQFHVGPNTNTNRSEEEMAEDELLANLKATYDRLKRGVGEEGVADEESPTEAVYRLRSAVTSAMENVDAARPLSTEDFGVVSNPDVLLLWSWSYAEDYPWRFLQEVKGRCGVGEAEASNSYEQCEAIVRGLLTGQLPWDVPPVMASTERIELFMSRKTQEYHQNVIAALKVCCGIGGIEWSAAMEATWLCALQHLRSGMDGA